MKEFSYKSKEAKLLAKALEIKNVEAAELLNSGDYIVLSDKEADDKAKEYVLDSVWAFNACFLSAHLKEGIDCDVVECIQANGKCEDNNEAIKSLIDDVEHFVNDAVCCDGRGHFISQYDGEEIELGNNYFAYRVN